MDFLHSIEAFTKLAELGSFTKTAEAMLTGRPRLTRTIQELEASLGVRLFQRTTRKVNLTPEGERFYDRAKAILSSVSETKAMFDHSGFTLRGRLRVDIPAAFTQRSFMQKLREFARIHPAIDLVLGVTDRTVDLVAEGIDCALRIGDLPDSSLVAKRIGAVTMVTCAAPAYLESKGRPASLADLDGHTGVGFMSGQSNRLLPWHFSVGGEDRMVNPLQGIVVNESNAYVQCGLSGFGVLQAPGIAVETYLASGELVEILKSFRPRSRPVSILYSSRTHLGPQVQAFITWLNEQFPVMHPVWFEAAEGAGIKK